MEYKSTQIQDFGTWKKPSPTDYSSTLIKVTVTLIILLQVEGFLISDCLTLKAFLDIPWRNESFGAHVLHLGFLSASPKDGSWLSSKGKIHFGSTFLALQLMHS